MGTPEAAFRELQVQVRKLPFYKSKCSEASLVLVFRASLALSVLF